MCVCDVQIEFNPRARRASPEGGTASEEAARMGVEVDLPESARHRDRFGVKRKRERKLGLDSHFPCVFTALNLE